MTYRRRITGWVLLGLVVGAVGQGCGSSAGPKRPKGSGAGPDGAGRDSGAMVVEPTPPGGAAGESPYNPLCGIGTNGCVPDDVENALCVEGGGKGGRSAAGAGGSSAGGGRGGRAAGGVPQGGADAAGEAGAGGASSGQGGEAGADPSSALGGGGAGGESSSGEPNAGGRSGTAAGGRAGVAGQASGGSGLVSGGGGQSAGTGAQLAGSGGRSPNEPSVGCQVVESVSKPGKPSAQCRDAGFGHDNSPCFSGADCAAGFACVGDGPGVCRAYCCDEGACGADTHCSIEHLVTAPKSKKLLDVPVCTPIVPCSLAEQYPCETGCSCPAKSACVVVGETGTTSCVPESTLPESGKGTEGKACPCAWGHVCSRATNECVRLCQVEAADQACESDRCQASPALPAGWGICVGVAPKDAGTPP